MKGQSGKNSGRKWSQLHNTALRGSFITMDSVYECVHLCIECHSPHSLPAGLRAVERQRFVSFGVNIWSERGKHICAKPMGVPTDSLADRRRACV